MTTKQKNENKSKFTDMNPIVVIAAMEIEFKYLLERLENVTTSQVNKFKYYEGTFNEHPIVICHCNVNTINATLATYIAIEKYSPVVIINEGTAGSHAKYIHKSDIVIGSQSINISSVKTPTKKEGEGSNSLEWSIANFASGSDIEQVEYQNANQKLINIAKNIEYCDGNVYIGVVGSGDVWDSEADRILWFNQKFNTLCEEMECFAVYTVANNFGVPAIAIKVISNNEILNEMFDEKTAIHSQKFVCDFISKLINEYT